MRRFILAISIIFILAISIILSEGFSGCERKPFCGFLVCKEYTPGHMSDEYPNVVQEAGVVNMPVGVLMRRSHYVEPQWVLYVANRYCIRAFDVDSLTYVRHEVGERICM